MPPSDHHALPSDHPLPAPEYDLPPPENDVPPPESPLPPSGSNLPPPGEPGPFCPNCRQAYPLGRQFCPHCGFNLEPVPQSKFFAGSNVIDFILALLLCVLCAPMVVTAIIPLVLYFVMDKRYIGFRKGLAAGLILYAVILLGGLAFCGYIIFALGNGQHH